MSFQTASGCAPEVQFILKLFPEGRLKIARHFSGGCQAFELNTVPQVRLK